MLYLYFILSYTLSHQLTDYIGNIIIVVKLDEYAVSRVAVWRQRRQRGRLSVAVPGRGEVSCAWSGACASDHGYAARQPHRGRQLWDRAESTAQAPARRAGRSLQADQVHTSGDTRHVPGIQTGRKRPGRPAGSTLTPCQPISLI